MSKKGFKVKRTRRNLYKKRKSTGRKVAEIVLLVLIVGALIFIGYSVAPPIIDFIQNGSETTESTPAWTPPVTEDTEKENTDKPSEETPASTTQKPQTTTTALAPKPVENTVVVTAPAQALYSKEALAEYLANAKQEGAVQRAFCLKDEIGQLWYKSELEIVKDNQAVIKGAMTLKEIWDECKKAGITPVIQLNTLYDRRTPYVITGTGFMVTDQGGTWTWNDNTIEKGGKPWTNPFSDKTTVYFADIMKELSTAGFKEFILSNTMFPNFGNYDYNLLGTEVQAADRHKKLTALCEAMAQAGKGDTLVKIDAEDLLTYSSAKYKATAELWGDKDSLKSCKLYVDLNASTLGKKLDLGNSKSITIQSDIVKAATQCFTEIKPIAGTDIVVGVSGATLTAQQKAEIEKSLKEMGFNDIIFG